VFVVLFIDRLNTSLCFAMSSHGPEVKAVQQLAADGVMEEDVPQQLATGITAPHQRPGAVFGPTGQDQSQEKWHTQPGPHYPMVKDRKELENGSLQPQFRRVDPYYVSHYKQHSGAPASLQSQDAIENRTFTKFNNAPIVDQDILPRRRFLRTPDGKAFVKQRDSWKNAHGQANPSDVAATYELQLNAYFAEERKHFDFTFEGVGNDKHTGGLDKNFPIACMKEGLTTVENTSRQEVVAGDIIRWIAPLPGGTMIHTGEEWLNCFKREIKNRNDPVEKRHDLPAEVYVVHDPNIETYHAVVEKGGMPGEQLLVKLCRQGQIKHTW
jgi:hypothetical protein